MSITAGLDVGGAHLKVALVADARPIAVAQFVCPLWQGLDKLDFALAAARPMLDRADRCAVTMTGELSDLFDTRRDGVVTITERLASTLGAETRYWMGSRGFGTPDCAIEHHHDVGSTNFLATATIVAASQSDAVVLDFGSTTADIIPILSGKPMPMGLTDALRQQTGELVYTGYTRTAVMAVAQTAPFQGAWISLAREYLATMADVRRILGELDPSLDLHATADGRGKSLPESIARLARMLGREATDGTTLDWQATSRWIGELQMRTIHDGLSTILSRHSELAGCPLVTAGIGADVAAVLALRSGMTPIAFGRLTGADPACERHATHWAPAVAVALLADRAHA